VPGVTYDTTAHKVTVTVAADAQTNALAADVSYDGAQSLVITNTFSSTKAHFEVTKSFSDWGKARSFTFVLAAVTDGAPLPKVTELTVTENAPTAVFADLTFDKVGTYEYTITEVDDHVPGVTYDTTAHKVTVTVTADAQTNALAADVSYDGAQSLVITNTYTTTPCTATPEVTKKLVDREWNDSDEFIFDITAVTEDAPMPDRTFATATRANRVAAFGTIEFTVPGVYVYSIKERAGSIPGMIYDTQVHTVIVTVTDEASILRAELEYDGENALTIINSFLPPPPPTGDSSLPVLAVAALMLAASGALLIIVLRRRRRGAR
ncbi:MAG: LPXTG cell wall anchor domain-containing protein, partial [Clostridia bacterium]|nr:LPXTG cell wall anchor domain-containing protein [Clostridia bacterium]